MFLKQVRWLMVASSLIALPTILQAQESVQDKVQRCGLISDVSKRLACYDQLAEAPQEMPVKSIESAVTEVPVKPIESAVIPPDELGAETLRGKHSKKKEPESVKVKVVKCSQSGRKNSNNIKYIFHLEGGQVWKQNSDKQLHFKVCNFDAFIKKDFFGYKMQVEDPKKKFRVLRIR